MTKNNNFKEQVFLTEDDLSDLLWLVANYGNRLEEYEKNDSLKLQAKLEHLLDQVT